MKILHQGAEAILFQDKGQVIKKRVRKGYRIPELDEKIRKQRTRLESSFLSRSRRLGIDVPRVFDTTGDFEIRMELIEGKRLKDSIGKMPKGKRAISYQAIGRLAASLHSSGIMHGDLTTSNMLLGDRLFLVDFGLAKATSRLEDFAVDLFLLYEAFKASHYSLLEEAWMTITNAYKKNFPKAKEVLSQLEEIKARRRYK